MRQIKIKVLGVELPYEVTDTSAEMNELAASVRPEGQAPRDEAHERAVANTIHHQVLGDLRAGLVAKLTAAPDKGGKGFVLRTKSVKKGDKVVQVVDETDGEAVARAVAEGVLTPEEKVQILSDLVGAKEYKFVEYLKSTERHASTPTLGKDLTATVEALFANGKNLALAAKLSGLLGRPVNGEDKIELGVAIREHRNREAKRIADELVGGL